MTSRRSGSNDGKPPLIGDVDLNQVSIRHLRQQVGYELNAYRLNRSLTQHQMGELFGVSQGTVSKWCTGARPPNDDAVLAIDGTGFVTSLGRPLGDLISEIKSRSDAQPTNHQVFLASPMASADDYDQARAIVNEMEDAIEKYTGYTVYNASRTVEKGDTYDASHAALKENLAAVKNCEFFVLLLPQQKLSKPSSVWVEAGAALAWARPSLYFVPNGDALPYILRTSVQSSNVNGWTRVIDIADNVREPIELVQRNRRKLFE